MSINSRVSRIAKTSSRLVKITQNLLMRIALKGRKFEDAEGRAVPFELFAN
jgi:hypothetical protein